LFDIAFSELVVIAIVALVVIGPEKLPKVARTLGLLLGRLQRYVANVKSDIEREMQFEDLQKLQQEIKQGVEEAQAGATEVENSIGGAHTQAKKTETPSASPQRILPK
jgi:sec-independent protein translocase protein TatB